MTPVGSLPSCNASHAIAALAFASLPPTSDHPFRAASEKGVTAMLISRGEEGGGWEVNALLDAR